MADIQERRGFSVADHSAMKLSKESAQYFGHDDSNFRNLIDSLVIGDVEQTMAVAQKGGFSKEQAALLIRDSAALASAMASIGNEQSW